MITGTEFAVQAVSEKYTGVPYNKMDCQAFVEQVLKDCGVRKPDGTVYNWAGSNSMWRNALSWKGTIAECREKFGEIPLGAWVFIIKHDGGEEDRGYHDSEGNASHVGIYCKNENLCVRDSSRGTTRNGVGYRELTSFTHVGLPKMISYTGTDSSKVIEAIHKLRDSRTSDNDYFESLVVLMTFMEGV